MWFLNYTNPMAMNCWAIARATPHPDGRALPQRAGHRVRAVRTDLGVPYREIDYLARGHQPHGVLPPASSATAKTSTRAARLADAGACPSGNRVRYEMLRRLGYFVTESSEHFAEYVPWFIKRDRPT